MQAPLDVQAGRAGKVAPGLNCAPPVHGRHRCHRTHSAELPQLLLLVRSNAGQLPNRKGGAAVPHQAQVRTGFEWSVALAHAWSLRGRLELTR